MTPERFRLLCNALGLIQSDQPQEPEPFTSAPRFLGVNADTVRKWARGKAAIPMAVAILLEVMVAYKIMPRDLARFDFEL